MANKVKFAFGTLENVDSAIAAGTVDSYDVLLLKDADGKPYIGWVDKDGNKVICEDDEKIIRVSELPTSDGDENVIYIYNNEGYIWNGTECVAISKSADLSALEKEIDTKVTAEEVKTMIKESGDSFVEIVEF